MNATFGLSSFILTWRFFSLFSDSICDPILKEELADKILSPESDNQKDMLIKMIQEGDYDLTLTFSSGGSDVL